MKKWLCFCFLLSAPCFASRPEVTAIVDKAKSDFPTYARLCADLVDSITKMSEVVDCEVRLEDNYYTTQLEKVRVNIQVDPEGVRKKRKLYEAKAEVVVGILSSKVKRKVKKAMGKEVDVLTLIPAYTQLIHKMVCKAFPELAPVDIEVNVTAK